MGGTSTASVSAAEEISMPSVDPETVRRLFTSVDVMSSERINTRFVVSRMGEVTLVRSTHRSRNCVSRRRQRHIDERESSYLFACMPQMGHLRISHMGRSCTAGKGDLCFVSSDDEYVIEMSDELDAMWLRIPTPLLQGHVISVTGFLGMSLDVSGGIGLSATELMRTSLRGAGEFSERGARLIGQSVVALLGELADSQISFGDRSRSSYCRKILARARDYVEEHLADEDLSPAVIAKGVGISPRYLSQLFCSEGVSVMRWVQRRRLERCRMELERNGLGKTPISEIAYGLGFRNICGFNRAFKSYFGKSPSEMIRPH